MSASDTPETDEFFHGEPILDEYPDFARKLERERDEARKESEKYKGFNVDYCNQWAEDHTYLQRACSKVGIPDSLVFGDSYGIPTIQCLVDLICAQLPRWIPVTESLPEEDSEHVIAWSEYFLWPVESRYSHIRKCWIWVSNSEGDSILKGVTHWQPMPKGPTA